MEHAHPIKELTPTAYVDQTIQNALQASASDIYWIPSGQRLHVRFRVEGQHVDVESLPLDYGIQCVTRLKVKAGLLTYRTLVAQDGAFRVTTGDAHADIRVAVMPTASGERITLRILGGRMHDLRHLDELNIGSTAIAAIQEMLKQPSGLIILTGPTGAGKTTTIYAMIRELLKNHQDPAGIITIEDPVEVPLNEISQCDVSRTSDWGYADAFRAALRQDVKTLVIGEMRDAEVVRITLDAALTGHRVITTYHAGDIASVYARMLHHGFEAFLIASAVTGVIAQRMVPDPTGDHHVPVVTTLSPNDAWRDFVAANPNLTDLRKELKTIPGASLRKAADALVAQGKIMPQYASLLP